MRPERGGSVRRLACLTALGCLLGAATAAGRTFVSAAPASAVSAAPASEDTCSAELANVEGGRLSNHYGTRADVYVNTNSTVNAYDYGFVRSLGVISDNNNFVEVGWSAHIAGTTSPQVFAEWNDRGTVGSFNYKLVNYGTNYGFTVDNVGHIEIFRFYFDGESSPFQYSPTMNFDTGEPLGNSERRNWCQSLYAHMYNLNDMTPSGSWETWDNWAGCKNTTSRNPYYMHKDSDTELHVTSSSSGAFC
jgi:hypothetical protein